MKPKNRTDWTEKSQRALFNAIGFVEKMLTHVIRLIQITRVDYPKTSRPRYLCMIKLHVFDANKTNDPSNSALDKLCVTFNLSYVERQTLLLVAGAELIPLFRPFCGIVAGASQPINPTFELAFKLFGMNRRKMHFFSFNNAPLLDWELVKFKPSAEGSQFKTLEIDKRILDYLLGYSFLDKRLENQVFPVASFDLFPKNIESIKHISLSITRSLNTSFTAKSEIPLIQLYGNSIDLKRQIINNAIEPLEFSLYELPWNLLPVDSLGLEKFNLLWTREALLKDYVLLLNCEKITQKDPKQLKILNKFLTLVKTSIIISTPERLSLPARHTINFETPDLSRSEQYKTWQAYHKWKSI